ncbi:TPA: hypothetical protein SBV22_000158 [Campylobacter coli]|uniref:DUF1374 domain-containing protein n=1 Tax=Campylobacter coli TaxID=195 RepID=A0A6C7TCB6_CAMCO|nr:hypothetical protein [Campylobacter coli]ECR2423247.1 hypothetical protein [Campylobacter coli]ECR3119192.1 hypothetical protein [Campylobacter coli]MDN2739687.1 hypothetical protein [Campylobacter coli]HEF1276048.1 hypothetical protein [Campylobacter coli]HEF9061300.1 hypothetical protein [Campylobacter coli]
MSKLISFALSFFSGDKKLYIALGLSLILLGYFYLRLDSTKAKLEKSQSDLALALEINRNNEAKLKELTQIHKAELKAINEANNQKNEVQKKVQYVKEYIYKSNENNLTKLFNDVVDRLWDDNCASSNQNRNSKSENTTRATNTKPH